MKKIVALLILGVSFMFAALNLQTATKEELMGIKGIGDKKAEQILEYRKTNKINSPEDLKNIKGFGDSIVSNIKKESGTAKEEVSDEHRLVYEVSQNCIAIVSCRFHY